MHGLVVRGAEHSRERQVPAVRRHGNGDGVVGHALAVLVASSNLSLFADKAHVAVLTGLLLAVGHLDPFLNLKVRDTGDLEGNACKFAGFAFGDAGGACVPFANGAAAATFNALPALEVGQLSRETGPTKALVADLKRARCSGGRHVLDAGLDDAGPVLSDFSWIQAIGLQPIPVLLVGLGRFAGGVTSQGVSDAVQVGLEGQLELLLAVAVTGLETCQFTGQGQAWGWWFDGSSGHVAHGLDCHVATAKPGPQLPSQLGVTSFLG